MLVSIQSLILVPDPYFNEPGFEQCMNTDVGRIASEEYNKCTKPRLIHWELCSFLNCIKNNRIE